MKKPLILVTGATGFVGREAVAQLVDAVKARKNVRSADGQAITESSGSQL
jgi:uncharacterized protein YbjT (DUF2867 family)